MLAIDEAEAMALDARLEAPAIWEEALAFALAILGE